MTCIVGVEEGGKVYIGGDSAGVSESDFLITARSDAKVFTRGPFVMGFTSSFRMGQLLRYTLKVPKLPAKNLEKFMATTFIDAVRTCLSKGGWLSVEDDRESGGTFLVGVSGHLFVVYSDFQVGRSLDGYDAVGCGDHLALGSLYATRGERPKDRVTKALEAAAHHSAGVSGPFVIKRAGHAAQ